MTRYIFSVFASLFSIFQYTPGPSNYGMIEMEQKKFAHEISKKFQVELLGLGNSITFETKMDVYGLNFTSGLRMNLSECRKLIVGIYERYWAFMQKNEHIHRDVKEFAEVYSKAPRELIPEHAAIKVTFWDENVERRMYPSVAQVRLVEGKIYYHYANSKTQALEEPIVESLWEAKKKVGGLNG